jgi:hypothetical protein
VEQQDHEEDDKQTEGNTGYVHKSDPSWLVPKRPNRRFECPNLVLPVAGTSNTRLRPGRNKREARKRLPFLSLANGLRGLAMNLGFEGLLAANIHLNLLGLGFRLFGELDL